MRLAEARKAALIGASQRVVACINCRAAGEQRHRGRGPTVVLQCAQKRINRTVGAAHDVAIVSVRQSAAAIADADEIVSQRNECTKQLGRGAEIAVRTVAIRTAATQAAHTASV